MGWGVSVEVSRADDSRRPCVLAETVPRRQRRDRGSRVHPSAARRSESHQARSDQTRHPTRDERERRSEREHDWVECQLRRAGIQRLDASKRSSLADLSINALSIEDGEIYFNDLSEKAAPIRVHHLDFDVTNFNAASAFDVADEIRLPRRYAERRGVGQRRPAADSRHAGRFQHSGRSQVAKFDSILLDSLRPLADIGTHIPAGAFDSRCCLRRRNSARHRRQSRDRAQHRPDGEPCRVRCSVQQARRNRDDVECERYLGRPDPDSERESQAVGSRTDGEQFHWRRRATAECANRFEQLQLRQSVPDDKCSGSLRRERDERSSRYCDVRRQRAASRRICDAKAGCAETGTVVAKRNQRSERHDSLRQRRRNCRADQLHARLRARPHRRTSGIAQSAQRELCAEGRLGEARADIRQPSHQRRRQRSRRQRYCRRRAVIAAYQRDDTIGRRFARKCFVQQPRDDGGLPQSPRVSASAERRIVRRIARRPTGMQSSALCRASTSRSRCGI